MDQMGLVLVALLVLLVSWLWSVFVQLVWRPYAIGEAFRKKGVLGPRYRIWVGSREEIKALKAAGNELALDAHSHDYIPMVLPHYCQWRALYGKVFLLWSGAKPTLCVSDYDMVKQILSNKTGLYPKTDPGPSVLALLGRGLVLTNGAEWARHRRVVHPAFTMDKLKMMTATMTGCAEAMIQSWEAQALGGDGRRAEVELGKQFQELTADVISHTAFGSSYREGKEVFLAQKELQSIAFASFNTVPFPGRGYLPTKSNRYRWKLEKKVRGTLMTVITERLAAVKATGGYGSDLLGLMLEANASAEPDAGGNAGRGTTMTMDEIIDECKTFFFAGHETTSHLLTWAMFLLGTHPEWQERLRQEVLRECGRMQAPTGDALSKLKLLTMVFYETLRLYGAVLMIARRTAVDGVELGGLRLPRGTVLTIPIAMMHRDEEVWGARAGEFDPARFEHGVGRAATHANALLAFSAGPRSCIGQDFAMMEAKAVMAMILQRFAFELAPQYVHAPMDFLTLQPKYGLPMVLKYLDA